MFFYLVSFICIWLGDPCMFFYNTDITDQIEKKHSRITQPNTDVTDKIEKHTRITKPNTDLTDQIEKHTRITQPNTDETDQIEKCIWLGDT
jgi:hypothetical protein